MINTIKISDYDEDFFLEVLYEYIEESYSAHRKQSNFYTRFIILIDEVSHPNNPELWGYWETNTFITDAEYGIEWDDITTLTRVEKKTKIITKEYWSPVDNTTVT